jgi:hypothetical protein
MAKGKLNTPWNRFWLLVSVLWMGVCWYGASTVNIPPDARPAAWRNARRRGLRQAGAEGAPRFVRSRFHHSEVTPGATLVPAPIAALQALAEKYGATVETVPQRHPEVKGDIFDQLAAADRESAHAERVRAIHTREFLIVLGTIGLVLWLAPLRKV